MRHARRAGRRDRSPAFRSWSKTISKLPTRWRRRRARWRWRETSPGATRRWSRGSAPPGRSSWARPTSPNGRTSARTIRSADGARSAARRATPMRSTATRAGPARARARRRCQPRRGRGRHRDRRFDHLPGRDQRAGRPQADRRRGVADARRADQPQPGHAGPMARSVTDAALLFAGMAGSDAADPATADAATWHATSPVRSAPMPSRACGSA